MDNQIPQITPEVAAYMRKRQIFIMAIEQAYAQGMRKAGEEIPEIAFDQIYRSIMADMPTDFNQNTVEYLIKNGGYIAIIFSHEFAQAFFGTTTVDEYGLTQEQRATSGKPGTWGGHYLIWQYHLMQLAVTPDRIAYLAAFLKPVEPKQEWRT